MIEGAEKKLVREMVEEGMIFALENELTRIIEIYEMGLDKDIARYSKDKTDTEKYVYAQLMSIASNSIIVVSIMLEYFNSIEEQVEDLVSEMAKYYDEE